MVRLLDRRSVASVYTMEGAIETTRAAFIALDEGHVVMPQRLATRVDRHRGIHLSMPCFVDEDRDVLSIKVKQSSGDASVTVEGLAHGQLNAAAATERANKAVEP